MQIKTGKEAAAVHCTAHGTEEHLCLKVYKDFNSRSFKNDAIYARSARPGTREERAIKGKSGFGNQLRQGMWLDNEYSTLLRLYGSGIEVPRPIHCSEHGLLMELITESGNIAPQLRHFKMNRYEARVMFNKIMDAVGVMLSYSVIHSDLSPFNILVRNGEPVIIDFPQAVDPYQNDNAFMLLKRDVENICTYFEKYEIFESSFQITEKIWQEQGFYMPMYV